MHAASLVAPHGTLSTSQQRRCFFRVIMLSARNIAFPSPFTRGGPRGSRPSKVSPRQRPGRRMSHQLPSVTGGGQFSAPYCRPKEGRRSLFLAHDFQPWSCLLRPVPGLVTEPQAFFFPPWTGFWIGFRTGSWIGSRTGSWISSRTGSWIGSRRGSWIGPRTGSRPKCLQQKKGARGEAPP